ncbi:hypothetical protein K491DRAFT_745555 [Lophiostoma macrostomum CBS 122681]|uniref:Rhodopsin domain-containing protein n=1 Tax=Lophiostoma macrostomum CBS 122681 TaxID=1314788 RepID=A0A6A6TB15_9PLEO|nr:hypothetical protein K491DRAFT_745555 [Lophiostoma macrostomum CBS 122681]
MTVLYELVTRRPGSEENLGPFLNVITWVLLIISGLSVLTTLVTKRALKRRIDINDGFIVAALITSVGSGIAVSFQTANGLGRDVQSLVDSQLVAYQKAEYANKLLYIATLASAKLSIISLLRMLTASELHQKFGIALTAFVSLWGIISELIAAFQCGARKPWSFLGPESVCSSLSAFWRAMGVLNLLTDLALILFPVHVIVTLQMSTGKKITILVFFGARSLDIVVTSIQIAYAPAFESDNPTHDLFKWTLTAQIVQCITVLTSCVPYLRPLLEEIPSGLYGADELRRRGTPSELGYSRGKSESYKLSDQSTNAIPKDPRPKTRRRSGIRRFMPTLSDTSHANSASGIPGGPRRPDGENGVEITGPGAAALGQEDGRKWDTDSTGSQAKILKTTVVSAAWEEAQNGNNSDAITSAKM